MLAISIAVTSTVYILMSLHFQTSRFPIGEKTRILLTLHFIN